MRQKLRLQRLIPLMTGFCHSLRNTKLLPRILTERGTEFCGALDKHPYEIYLQYHKIDHIKTRARGHQSNGFCEAFHKTVLNEFYRVTFKKKIYSDVEELQKDASTLVPQLDFKHFLFYKFLEIINS